MFTCIDWEVNIYICNISSFCTQKLMDKIMIFPYSIISAFFTRSQMIAHPITVPSKWLRSRSQWSQKWSQTGQDRQFWWLPNALFYDSGRQNQYRRDFFCTVRIIQMNSQWLSFTPMPTQKRFTKLGSVLSLNLWVERLATCVYDPFSFWYDHTPPLMKRS